MSTTLDMDMPLFDVHLPFTKKTLTFRPFVVKEEKLLLMAAASGDTQDIIKTTLQVVENCLVGDTVKISSLPFFEVDYLFITLRAKSIGETVDVNFICNHSIKEPDGDHKCGTIFPVALDILKADFINAPIKPSGNKINLGVSSGVVMKYPSYKAMKVASESLDSKLDTIKASIDSIWKGDKVYKSVDLQPEDLDSFMDNLTMGQVKLLEQWVDNFPSFILRKTQPCPKCGFVHDIVYKDFQSFF